MTLRVATFNASLNRSAAGDLIDELKSGDSSQAQSVAEIIQRTNADVILVNEFDYDAKGRAAKLFQKNYLDQGQNGADPVDYPYVYVAPSNTGVSSGLDLDNSGGVDDFAPNDAYGFGFFEGQFSFAIYSKYPIDEANIRTFQEFLWKDMPGNLLTEDPTDDNLADYYSEEAQEALRLSSKNHVDLPVIVDGETVHILAAHPTPPVFDGPEDRNGKRNHDEIKFWADYVEGADYIYDDQGGKGGLEHGARFVIVGDYNADPFDGDSFDGAAQLLLDNEAIIGSATDKWVTPASDGGPAAADRQNGANDTHLGDAAFDTADFGFNADDPSQDNSPGNLRVDYALPSEAGFAYLDGGVFWVTEEDPLYPLPEFPTSDHRLVYVDLAMTDDDRVTQGPLDAEEDFLGVVEIESGFDFEGTTLGGLSGITYNPVTGTYLAVSDDRGAPRYYDISIDLADGALDTGDVTIEEVVALTQEGVDFAALTPDLEGIAIGAGGQIYLSTERFQDQRVPQIFTVDGDEITGELTVPRKFKGVNDEQGVRNNLGFESLTITPDQQTLWTATESALTQDGPAATLENGSAARILRYDLDTGLPVAEYIYEVDPIATEPDPADGFADSGLVELLALDNRGTLLALERSFSIGAEDRGYTGKLYLVETQGATDVSGEKSVPILEEDGELEVDVDAPVKKTLIADLGDLGLPIDNIEGMTLGPVLADGRQSLVIVSDDNFSAFGPQATQFLAYALDLETIPTLAPVAETPDDLRYESPTDLTEGTDSDDPAIWIHPKNEAKSVVVATAKNGGLRVFDLEGEEIQRIEPDGIRYNNVDILYDVSEDRPYGGDIAIASDRENDTLAVFRIARDGTLTEVTAPRVPGSIFGVDDGEATAYGLTAWRNPADGKAYVFVTQADGNQIAQLELVEKKNGFSWEPVRMLEIPTPRRADKADYQSEGIVIDRETGIGYVAAEEEVGLMMFEADPRGSDELTVIAPIDDFSPDIEGLSIYYGKDGDGMILVSSQGDSTFHAYDRADHSFLGKFALGNGKDGIDGVEESDGAEIYSGSLPGYKNGLLVTQDGSNEDQVVFVEPGDDETEVQNWNTNFKYTDLGDVLALYDIRPNRGYDPRDIDTRTLPEGVAAGDVTEDSVVLWARSTALGRVTFKVFEQTEDGLVRVARKRVEVTDTDVPAKVEIDDLDPGKTYVYRVRDAAGTKERGQFNTAHAEGQNGLTFGITGDWRGDLGPYPAVSNAADKALDFFVFGGDTIYADFDTPAGPATLELDGFRGKYQEVYGTTSGQNYFAELKASTAIYATIDDHEVVNDFAGWGKAADDARLSAISGRVNDTVEFEEGLQAFHEYHPIAEEFYGDTGDRRTANERDLYRSQSFGEDAAIMVLDQRSFRDQQIDGVADVTDLAEIGRFLGESFDPERTLLGDAQLDRLKADLVAAQEGGVTWKFVYAPEPMQHLGIFNADSWDGYRAERTEILSFIEEEGIDNVVFVAADIHATFVNNLTYAETPGGTQLPSSAWEITTGSVAFDPAFGPAVVGVAAAGGLLPDELLDLYNALPIAPEAESAPSLLGANDKDEFVTAAFETLTMNPQGLDPLGLDRNLEGVDIDATLLQGGYVSAHSYGWTEFDIDAETQVLTVTTWGIPGYGPDEAAANAETEPTILSQFEVNPTGGHDDMITTPMLETADGWGAKVLHTVGETIGDYTPVGVMDGLGAYALDDSTVRVYANHELLHFRGNEYEVSDGNGGTFSMIGARISYFDIDIETREITDAGLAYNTIVDANGDVASDISFLPTTYAPFFGGPEDASQWQGFSRFCSSVLVEAEQFGNNRGLADTIYFAGEEDGTGFNAVGGAEWALDVETGTMYQVPAMGRGAWENITEVETGNKKHVAFILADDSAPYDFDGDGEVEAAPLFLYVGRKKKTSEDFLERNGLDNGKLYVWVANAEEQSVYDELKDYISDELDKANLPRWQKIWLEGLEDIVDANEENEGVLESLAARLDIALGDEVNSPAEFRGTGETASGEWVKIDNKRNLEMASEDGSTGYDEYGYPTQGNLWLQAKEAGAFQFSRPEDVATNPDNGAEFVMASTGVDTFDISAEDGDGYDTFGTTYTMELDFSKKGKPKASDLKIIYDGDDDVARLLRSPDNLDWADDGYVYVQEDRAEADTAGTGEVLFGEGATNQNEAGILKLNPETGEVERIANIDRSVVLDGSLRNPEKAVDVDAGEVGAWESSGILDVSALFDEEPGTLFLADVQAHGIEDQTDINGKSRINDGDLVEGGQLLFLGWEDIV